MVELQPSKLVVRVRFPSPAPILNSLLNKGKPQDMGGFALWYKKAPELGELSLISLGLYSP